MAEQAERKPYFDCNWDVTVVSAVKAIGRGDATPDQQRKVLGWIIEQAALTYDLSFQPGDALASAFVEGRRFVGLKVLKLLNMNVAAPAKMKGESNG